MSSSPHGYHEVLQKSFIFRYLQIGGVIYLFSEKFSDAVGLLRVMYKLEC